MMVNGHDEGSVYRCQFFYWRLGPGRTKAPALGRLRPAECALKSRSVLVVLTDSNLLRRLSFPSRPCASTPISSMQTNWHRARHKRGTILFRITRHSPACFLITVVLSLVVGGTRAQTVPTNTALRSLPSTKYSSVTRLGFSSPGDGGRAIYVPSGSACSLNGGDGDNGSQVRSADGLCLIADFSAGPPSVKVFGAAGDGVTDDRTALLACLGFSAIQHTTCRVPAGAILAVDDVTIRSGATLIGDGPQLSTIRRIAFSRNSNGVLHCSGCSNSTISELGIDGNKANETVASAVIHFTKYSSITINKASIFGAKGYDGIWLDNSRDQSASGLSTISDCLIYLNDRNGVFITTATYNLTLQNVFSNANGSYGFYAGPTSPADNLPDTLRYISIEGGGYSGNGNSGVAAQGFITGYLGGQPVFGPGIWPVSDIKVRGVTANGNGAYGIVLQTHRGLVADSIANGNNTLEVNGAGVLPTCNDCEISNVTTNANGVTTGVGIDAGCAIGAHIRGGSVSNNVIGINIGCSTDSDVRGVNIINSTVAGITAYSTEASGDGFGIPGFTNNLSITENRVACSTSGNGKGIWTTQGATNLEIAGNYVEGCTLQNGIVSDLYSGRIAHNIINNKDMAGTDYTVNSAKDALLIPDGVAEPVTLTGVNRFSHIFRLSQASVGTGIGGVRVDTGGSGFINNDNATIIGCSTNPTGVTVAADRAGHLTGLRLGTRGAGCTTPTASFTHGSGQALTMMVGAWQNTSDVVTLLVYSGGALTILGGGNILLRAGVSGVGGDSLLRFRHVDGRYVEEGRNF
jgi:hypothetical protein